MLCLISVPVFGQTNPTTRLTRLPPVRIPGISDIVGTPTNQWLYVWPHNLVPDRFTGLGVKSTPIDRTKKNQGCTMQNWGRAVVLTNTTMTVEVTCRRDYPMSTSQPWLEPSRLPVSYTPLEFHDLPAGVATPPNGAATTMYFAFRLNDVVFDLTANGGGNNSCKPVLLDVADQVLKFNMTKTQNK